MASPRTTVFKLYKLYSDYGSKLEAKTSENAKILEQFGLGRTSSKTTINAKRLTQWYELGKDWQLELVGDELSKVGSEGEGSKKESEALQKDIESNLALKSSITAETGSFFDVSKEKVLNSSEFKECLNIKFYNVDPEKLKDHLEKFLKNVGPEEEAYKNNEIEIKYYSELKPDVEYLLGAGTKVLDALIFCAVHDDESVKNIFKLIEIKEISKGEVTKNLTTGKRAIQAGLILTFIAGGLPVSGDNEIKPIPNFIKTNIYNGEVDTLNEIANQLSCCSTRKFPAKVFLNMPLDKLPVSVASRCKLGIAGNKCVRYAVFAKGCERMKELDEKLGSDAREIYEIVKRNERTRLAINITDFLCSLLGNYKAQLVMHPLSPNKPAVNKLTIKLTRAIIESLSPNGRMNLYRKIVEKNISAFTQDPNFYGEGTAEERTWNILNDADADFADLSITSLKNIYGIN